MGFPATAAGSAGGNAPAPGAADIFLYFYLNDIHTTHKII
jgi:hypothetical protein